MSDLQRLVRRCLVRRCLVRRCLVLGLLAWAIVPVRGQDPDGWTLEWADEFEQPDGSSPDPAKWDLQTGAGGWGNNELQYYTSRAQNARVEDGFLIVEARAEAHEGSDFTSARLRTKEKASWTFGRIEARMKLPRGNGIWPAFWMLGDTHEDVGWPDCGEIDIMENIGSLPAVLHGTIHGPGYSAGNGISGSYTLAGGSFGDDFHVFGIEWDENRIRWMLDGRQYFTVTPGDLPGGAEWVLNQPHHLLLNIAVGGNWPGPPDGSTVFPQRLVVDYVRVYSRIPLEGANVLENAGFESGNLDGWNRFGADASTAGDAARSGARSVKVAGDDTGGANDSGVFQDVPALPGEIFRAESRVLSPASQPLAGSSSAFAEVTFHDGSGTVLSWYQSSLFLPGGLPDLWYPLPVSRALDPADGSVIGMISEMEAPAGTAFVRKRVIYRDGGDDGGSVRFDDLSLFKVGGTAPSPSTVVTLDPGASWNGYMNVSELPENGGGYVFGSTWNPADLRAGFDGPVVTLAPNSIGDPSPFWYVGGGSPGNPGNKMMDANFYVEETDQLSGRTITFKGDVIESSLTAAHDGVAFIKDFAPDYSSYQSATVPLVEGRFSVDLETLPGPGRHVQYGFRLLGPNVWVTDAEPFGSVQITAVPLDPFADWIGGFDFSAMVAPDLTAGGDPDGDGQDNLTEFALDGDPSSGVATGKVISSAEETPDGKILRITLPVRGNPVFTGELAKSATVGDLVYEVEGSNDLETFDQEVVEVAPSAAGMPGINEGWTYRTFRLAGELDGVAPRGPTGYLRVRVSPAP